MSGRKHHIVPRFLQLGFAINEQTNVYTKEKVYVSNIKDVLAERDFYSSPVDTTIDDKITSREAELYLKVLSDLLSLPTNVVHEISNDITETLLHFIFRTKYFREQLIKNLISVLENSFDEEFKKTLITEMIKRAKPGNSIKIKKMVEDTDFFPKEYKELIKNVFIEKLNELIINDKQLSSSLMFRNCHYKIIKTEESLILPDCFLTFLLKKGVFTPFPEDEFDYLFFPIENNKLLIISKTKDFQSFNINDLKLELIKSSNEKFIARSNKEKYLQKYIGQNKFLLFIEEIKAEIKLNQKQKAIECINNIKKDLFNLSPEKYHKFFK